MSYQTILYEKVGHIATLTMNRPDRMNAMTNRMVVETGDALAAAAEDRDVRVLILTGAGSAFCPGADISGITSGSGADVALAPEDFRAPVLLHSMPAITIAAVNGACAGAALGWAAACDLRVASSTARFNTAFLAVGVAGDMGGPWSLARLLGSAKARELYLFPDKFDAAEALRIGLVSHVFEPALFRAGVDALAARLVASPPITLRTLKANFVDSERVDFAAYVALESERHLRLFTTHDTREAFAAKAEKREPNFLGR